MIDILLSTYNGEKYLKELLQSIINQTFIDWKLFIRDDFSTDKTLEIIDFFCEKYDNKIFLLKDNFENIGVSKSFGVLLEKSTADFIMFCDQDDVWLPTKIEKTFSVMQKAIFENPKKPILVCTDLKIVDENLQVISNSMWQCSKILPELLKSSFEYLSACNFVTGCTMLLNKEAKKNALPFDETTKIHDLWIALKVLIHNGLLIPVYEQTILYRQHSDNKFGAPIYEKNYFFYKIKTFNSTLKSNKETYTMAKSIKKINIFTYLTYKIKYFFKRK